MVQRVSTVAFEGIEARAVDVQVQIVPGLPAFANVETISPKVVDVGYGREHLTFAISGFIDQGDEGARSG
jgi:hypothetical protein